MFSFKRFTYYLTLLLVACVQSCSLIDDDLTYCGYDYEITYRLRLRIDLDEELSRQLYSPSDVTTIEAVREKMAPIFSNIGHDLDVAIIPTTNQDAVTSHNNYIIDASEATYNLYLKVEDYLDNAVANVDNNMIVSHDNQATLSAALYEPNTDTIAPQRTGLFAGRLPIAVADTANNATFEVILHQVNSAVVLLIDDVLDNTSVEATVEKTATGFALSDSVFLFDRATHSKMEHLSIATTFNSANAPANNSDGVNKRDAIAAADLTRRVVMTTVCMPSADYPTSGDVIWQVVAHVTGEDGTITQTILGIHTPLEAGTIRVLRTQMEPNGSLTPIGAEDIGFSVQLDWKQGSEFNQEL